MVATPWATPCIIHGDKVYLAGIIGRLASGQSGEGTIGDQTKQVLSTAEARLKYVGLDLRDSESSSWAVERGVWAGNPW